MKRSLVVLVSMFLACSVFGQDAPQTKTESTSSYLSIHFAPGVSIHPDTALSDTEDVAIRTGPAVSLSLIGRFPSAPWLIGSLALFGEYHTADLKGSSSPPFWLRRVCPIGSIVRYRSSVFTGSTIWSRLWVPLIA
jgi:hypothetical protein